MNAGQFECHAWQGDGGVVAEVHLQPTGPLQDGHGAAFRAARARAEGPDR